MNVNESIAKLEALHFLRDKENLSVSKGNVGWHIDHCYRVIIGIIKSMQKSDPVDYKWSLNLMKILIMKSNWYPRGRVKAPKAVDNREIIQLEGLEKLNLLAKKMESEANELAAGHYFKHPYFGDMKRDEAMDFLGLHTHHHLKIVRDILK